MTHQIRITSTNGTIEAVLMQEVVILWFFNMWVTVATKEGNRDDVFDRVADWICRYDIDMDNVTDLTDLNN
jgi:hypothetical protein